MDAGVERRGTCVPAPTPASDGAALGYFNDAGTLAGKSFVGFWRRVLASLIDYAILWLVFGAVSAVVNLSATPETRQHLTLSCVAAAFNLFVGWLYFSLLESSAMQAAVGKRVVGVRVVDAGGARLGFARASGRLFAKKMSGLPLCGGFILVGLTPRKQGLHDLIASTYVVRGAPTSAARGVQAA